MKLALVFLAGVGTAWAALAIWQHRAIPDIDPADVPDVVPDELDDIVYRGRRPGYRESTAEPSPDRWRGDCVGFGGGSTL